MTGFASTDVCVPISKLGEIISASEEIVNNSYARDLAYGFLGHVGDGNFHIFMPVNDEKFQELKAEFWKVWMPSIWYTVYPAYNKPYGKITFKFFATIFQIVRFSKFQ